MGQLRACVNKLGQAKIGNQGSTIGADDNVGRLDVTMQNALLMGVINCPGHSGKQLGGFALTEWSTGHCVRTTFAQ